MIWICNRCGRYNDGAVCPDCGEDGPVDLLTLREAADEGMTAADEERRAEYNSECPECARRRRLARLRTRQSRARHKAVHGRLDG